MSDEQADWGSGFEAGAEWAIQTYGLDQAARYARLLVAAERLRHPSGVDREWDRALADVFAALAELDGSQA